MARPRGFLREYARSAVVLPTVLRSSLSGMRCPPPRAFHRLRRRNLGPLRPEIAGSVLVIDQFTQTCAVMRRRIGRRPATDQSVPTVDRDVVLVAERRNRDVD